MPTSPLSAASYRIVDHLVQMASDRMPSGDVEAEFHRLREKLGGELITTVGAVGYRIPVDDE